MKDGEIVEVMARALYSGDLSKAHPDDAENHRDAGRAVLAALRAHRLDVLPVEATEGMLASGMRPCRRVNQ